MLRKSNLRLSVRSASSVCYHVTLTLLTLASLATYAQLNVASAISSSDSEYSSKLRGAGMAFTPNKGQYADASGKPLPGVLYKGEGGGGGGGAEIYLRTTGVSYVQSNMGDIVNQIDKQVEELSQAGVLNKMDEQKKKEELLQKQIIKVQRVDMDFEGANTNCRLINEDELQGCNNYYYAHCPNGVLNVKQYNKVTYKNIYAGIDIAHYGDRANGLKYDLIVHPHADPNQIKLSWKGVEKIKLENSKLVVETSLGTMTETLPKVYQNINGKIVDVECKYKLDVRCEMLDLRGGYNRLQSHVSCLKSHIYEVSFELGAYNIELPLIIDPWATYYGGTAADYGYSTACDNAGNVYMAGTSISPNTGNAMAVAPGFQTILGGAYDAFLVKFNAATGARIWGTYYGGTGTDFGYNTTCDNAGNVYLTGYTYSPNTSNEVAISPGFQTIFGGSTDAFLVQFNSASGARNWGTYYGGTGNDTGTDVACDNAGNVYLAGYTDSPNTSNVIAVAPGIQTVLGGGIDAFLVKFNSTGGRVWGTYYGGVSSDYGFGVTCDNAGNVYITGYTGSPNTANAVAIAPGFQTAHGGGFLDAFLAKFNTAGMRVWATYYGGTADDRGFSTACDNIGNVYLAGFTSSPNTGNAIATPGAHQTVFGGGTYDPFLVQFNSITGARNWGTYYGSTLTEIVPYYDCLAIDGNNNVYLYMEVEDVPGPSLIDPCAYQPNFAGGIEDQIIVKFNQIGKKICATYFGGTGYEDIDFGGGIAISGNLLFICASNGKGAFAGATAGGYPVTPGAWQTVHGGTGSYDAVLACLCINICEGKASLGIDFTAVTGACANTPVTFTPSITNSCDTTGYKYHWVFTNGNPTVSDLINPTVSFTGAGTHDVKLVVTTPCKKDSLIKTNYITTTTCNVCNLTAQFTKGTATCTNCGCQEWVLVNAINGTAPYTYLWPDGYDKRYKNKICAGNYTVKITDKNGCSVDVNVTAP